MHLSEAGTVMEGLYQLVPLIVFIPALGLLVNILLGRRLGERFAGTWASVASGGAFVISLLQWVALRANHGDGHRRRFPPGGCERRRPALHLVHQHADQPARCRF